MTAGNDVVDLSKWNGTGSVNIGDAFSSDNDKVTVMANALAGTVAKNNLELTSIENLEIVNSGVKTTPVILKGANFKGLEAIKLIGDDTNLDVAELTQGVKIDATANADTITGSDKADTINGGAGNDIIRAGSGNDVLTGGNGADTFIVGSVQSLGIDKILDFSAEDKISMNGFVPGELKKFDASTFSTVNYKTLDSVLATFGPGGANVTKAGDVVIFSYDGKTYALLSTVAGFKETNGALVDITGANVASLTESNFGESSLYTYENYTAFTTAIDNGERIPDGEAIIKTMTVTDAGNLAINNNLLAKVANGGIKEITDGNTIAVAVPVDRGIGEFDARIFDSKLGADVVDVTLNINGSANTDIIYASKFGGTINGSGGDDRIDASNATGAVTIEGGAGNDNISLGAGADTVVFGASKAANGVDTITGFEAGAGGDVLAIGSGTNVNGLLGAAFDPSKFTKASGSGDLTSGGTETQVLIHAGDAAIVAGANSSSFDSSGTTKYKMDSNQKLFIVDTVNNANILYLATESSGNVTVEEVGTLNAGADIASTLTADNFGNVA